MTTSKEEIRYLLKIYYNKEKNAIQAGREISEVYGDDVVSARVA